MLWFLFGLLLIGGVIGAYIAFTVLAGYIRGMKIR
jgi:hypothetical protein